MRRNELDFQKTADSFIRQHQVCLTVDGQEAGPEIHGFRGLAPYVFLHATRLADAAHLPSMAMPMRFYQDPQSLLGLSCEMSTSDQAVSGTDLVIGMMTYGHAFSHMRRDIEHFAQAVPDGWGHLVQYRGDQAFLEIEGFEWVSRMRYGDDLNLVKANQITQGQSSKTRLSLDGDPAVSHGILREPPMPLSPGVRGGKPSMG